MEVVTIGRKYQGVFRQYEVMPKDEADRRDIAYKPWREANGGDWAISDDGYVSQVIAVSEFHAKGRPGKKPRRLVILPWARAWTKQHYLSFVERHRSGNYFETGRKDWAEEEARKLRTKNAVDMYVQMVLNGGKVDWDMIGRAYRPDQEIPEATVRRLFKNERIKKMVQDTLQQILKKRGITQESVIATYQEAINVAIAKGDAAAMVRSNDRLAALVGLDITTGRKMLPAPTDQELETEAERLLDHVDRQQPQLPQGSTDETPEEP